MCTELHMLWMAALRYIVRAKPTTQIKDSYEESIPHTPFLYAFSSSNGNILNGVTLENISVRLWYTIRYQHRCKSDQPSTCHSSITSSYRPESISAKCEHPVRHSDTPSNDIVAIKAHIW